MNQTHTPPNPYDNSSSYAAMRRRRFLEIAVGGSGFVAGCSTDPGTSPSPSTRSESRKSTPGRDTSHTLSDSAAITHTQATTTAPDGADIYVDPNGSADNPGTKDDPVGSIQVALNRASAGERIHVLDGEYQEQVHTVRSGEPGAPITLTSSANAVLRGKPDVIDVFRIRHSHIHLRGLTITGLHNPDRPDDPNSYAQVITHVRPQFETNDYIQDLVLAPAGIGHSYRTLFLLTRVKDVEIGPTEIVGLAGAVYVLGDAEDHTGEIVYLGTPPEIALHEEPRPGYPWKGLDEGRRVHIHHLDNSAGYPHSELVNTKLGTRDVLVEYCTSLGGSQNTEPYPTAEVRFQSHEATLRWSEFRNGEGYGVHVVQHDQILQDHPEATMAPEEAGADHSIYGNVITGFGDGPLSLSTGFDAQRLVCDNVVMGRVDGNPVGTCPSDIPMGDGIGHVHTPRSEFPSFREVILQFSRTLSPEELGDPEADWHLALRVHQLELLDDAGDTVLAVDVGAEDDAVEVVWGDGIYQRLQREGKSWRFFGGADETANLFVTAQQLRVASRLRLRGTAIADDIDMGVSLGGGILDEVALVPNENRWYSLSLESN